METNGTSKIVRIITLVILIAGLLVTFGATYASLNIKINMAELKIAENGIRSSDNKDAIITIRSDLKYIIKGIDELRGKR